MADQVRSIAESGLGEREIVSLRRELDHVRRQIGFNGTLAQFQASLRTNPRYFSKTPEEVGARLSAFAATMEPKMDSWFQRCPGA